MPVLHIPVLRRNARLLSNFSLMSVTGAVHQQADKLMVSALLPVASLGYYNFAYHLIQRATFMRSAVTSALYPALSRLAAAQADELLRQQYRKWFDLLTTGLGPVFAAALYVTVPLFSFVFDPAVAQMMVVPMAFLILGTYMNTTLTVPHVTSMAVGRPDIMARINIYAIVIMLPLTYLLIWRFGLWGAAITWPLYHLVIYSLFIPKFCRECLPLSIAGWFGHTGRILLTALLPYGGIYAAIHLGQASANLGILAAGYLAASVIYGALAYWTATSEMHATIVQAMQYLAQHWLIRSSGERPAHRQ